ncbi:gp436 family protein [Vibrio nomapromontoriensis]|uniref:gp436 family protein n=1 Tax=Vibrio nomapromontoriensis TaxID=2910246 RepID=UPI003D13EE0A
MYCTVTQLQGRFSEQELIALTDKDGSTGALVLDVAEQAIKDASSTIDGYLGGRYALPLRNVPTILERICCDLSRYYLYDDTLGEEHQAAKRYVDAVKYLEQVGRGQVQLGLSDTQTKPEQTNSAEMMSAGSVFGRDSAKGFI